MARKFVVWNMKISPALREALRREAWGRSTPGRLVDMKDIVLDALLAYDTKVARRVEAIRKEWGGDEPPKEGDN